MAEFGHCTRPQREAREALARAFDLREFCAGVEIFKEGMPNSTAYFILEGEVRLSKQQKLPTAFPDYGKNIKSLDKFKYRLPT